MADDRPNRYERGLTVDAFRWWTLPQLLDEVDASLETLA